MNYTFCLTVHDANHDLQEYNNIISFFQFLNPNFDSLPNDEKWIFVSTINDHYANYILCSFVAKSCIIRKSLINNILSYNLSVT